MESQLTIKQELMYYRYLEQEIKEPMPSLKEELGPEIASFIDDIKESWSKRGWLFAVLTVVIATAVMVDVVRKRLRKL